MWTHCIWQHLRVMRNLPYMRLYFHLMDSMPSLLPYDNEILFLMDWDALNMRQNFRRHCTYWEKMDRYCGVLLTLRIITPSTQTPASDIVLDGFVLEVPLDVDGTDA